MEFTLGQLINSPETIQFTFGLWIFWLVIHIAFAIGVYKDAKSRVTVLVSPFIWSLTVLFGGVYLAGGYWLIHHSILANKNNAA